MENLENYYGLVIYRAKKVYRSLQKASIEHIELRELIESGFEGLLEANRSYDPQKGAFVTFATWRIDGAIKDYLRELDPLTHRERQKVRELDEAKEELSRILGQEPSAGELAAALGISEEELRKREKLKIILLSLEDLAQLDEETGEKTPPDIPSPQPGPDEEVIKKELANTVHGCLEEALDQQERRVLLWRVLEEISLQTVGDMLAISKDTVQRREVSAKRKMQHCLEQKGWEVTDI
jgi:RNA polymerase sigma factor for flagellar operon FliA